ncbi:MAG: molybdopterin-dependent oxidoreductase [Chloroflexi bacterium]|nr:molybdopterin-dependent oxidoreductase [Chloroflexota bacterium]
MDLGFPLWVRVTHMFNILFISLLMRSGIEILAAHPKLYLNDDSVPGKEWIRFTPRKMPSDRLWTSRDEEEEYTAWLALPGMNNLGLGRQWHFFGAIGWALTGLVYIIGMATSPEWQRLIPTSWDIFPGAYHAALIYLRLELPPAGNPFNPLQQLAYFALIFLLAPLQILTAMAMSPAVIGRAPWYPMLFGGRQIARSIHFLGLVAFITFTVHHVLLVIVHGLGDELAKMVLGIERGSTAYERALAIGIMGGTLFVIGLIHVWGTRVSRRQPRRMQHLLETVVDPVKFAVFHPLTSHQYYKPRDITPDPRVNGRPPKGDPYDTLARDHFADWALEVTGLVEEPLRLTLPELRAMERQTQITKHNCIQGWSMVAEWSGIPVRALLERCRPLPAARYLVLHAFDEKPKSEPHPAGPGTFYGTIDFRLACERQTILAYDLNGAPLPIEHGAPLRLRVESQLGFKMVKWVRSIELVADFKHVGDGQGGWREDKQYYSTEAGI